MKKLLGLFLASAMLLSLNVPSFAAETHEITSSNYPAYIDNDNTGMEFTLYFTDGARDLPYKVTLLGRTSGGGSCSVLFSSSAWGTSFQISSNQRMSFLKNGSFYDVDRGAEPDYVLTSPESYYDRAALTDYINSLP